MFLHSICQRQPGYHYIARLPCMNQVNDLLGRFSNVAVLDPGTMHVALIFVSRQVPGGKPANEHGNSHEENGRPQGRARAVLAVDLRHRTVGKYAPGCERHSRICKRPSEGSKLQ